MTGASSAPPEEIGANLSDDGDANLHELRNTLELQRVALPSMYQLHTVLRIEHKPHGPTHEQISARSVLTFTAVNPFDAMCKLEPFQTTVKKPVARGLTPFRLIKYRVFAHGSGDVLFALDPADVRSRVHKPTGELEYYATGSHDVAARSSVDVIYESERVIPYHDTYKYIPRLRAVKDMVIEYSYGEFAAKSKRVGMRIFPKLTLISHSAAIARLDNGNLEGSASWRVSGWLVPGNGIVLSW